MESDGVSVDQLHNEIGELFGESQATFSGIDRTWAAKEMLREMIKDPKGLDKANEVFLKSFYRKSLVLCKPAPQRVIARIEKIYDQWAATR